MSRVFDVRVCAAATADASIAIINPVRNIFTARILEPPDESLPGCRAQTIIAANALPLWGRYEWLWPQVVCGRREPLRRPARPPEPIAKATRRPPTACRPA